MFNSVKKVQFRLYVVRSYHTTYAKIKRKNRICSLFNFKYKKFYSSSFAIR